MPDFIRLAELELSTRIGVPDEERLHPQRLTLNLTLELDANPRALNDSIENTVDYFVVARTLQKLARDRPRKLIETLAEEIATASLAFLGVNAVSVELRKYILPDTAYVAVGIRRER